MLAVRTAGRADRRYEEGHTDAGEAATTTPYNQAAIMGTGYKMEDSDW